MLGILLICAPKSTLNIYLFTFENASAGCIMGVPPLPLPLLLLRPISISFLPFQSNNIVCHAKAEWLMHIGSPNAFLWVGGGGGGGVEVSYRDGVRRAERERVPLQLGLRRNEIRHPAAV